MNVPHLSSLKGIWATMRKDLREMTGIRAFPSLAQWRKLPSLLTKREWPVLFVVALVFVLSFSILTWSIIDSATLVVPKQGGSLTEGMVGTPRFINPVYADARDIDRDITQLVFSGIMRLTADGTFAPDLAKRVDVKEDGRVYDITLREDVFWHDGKRLTAQDVAFTIQTIQNPVINSPLRAEWVGIEVEVISEYHIRLSLQDSFVPFLERLASLKILPAHIWRETGPENFPLSWRNFQAIGTGPYRVQSITQDKTGTIEKMLLQRHSSYHLTPPYISSVTIRFFPNEEDLLREANRGTIDSFSLSSPVLISNIPSRFTVTAFSLPRYFAVFFNQDIQNDSPLKNLAVREALSFAIDRETLVKEALGGYGSPVTSLLLPNFFSLSSLDQQQKSREEILANLKSEGYVKKNGMIVKAPQETVAIRSNLQKGSQGSEVRALQECLARFPDIYPNGTVSGNFGPATEQAVLAFQEKYAQEILAPSGLTQGTGRVAAGTKDKLQEICAQTQEDLLELSFTLTTVDRSPLKEVAQQLVSQWKDLGVDVKLKLIPSADIANIALKPRAFEALLFGNLLGIVPDPFPFWHSSQRHDPGRNLSQYKNQEADRLLEDLRKESNEEKRKEIMETLQGRLLKDIPAIALHDLDYLYVTSPRVKGVQSVALSVPSQRFSFLPEWYIKTRRTWK
ncbi:MAG: ABC transporter substrate-binding protein [bacterium]|nr:ABC transporter substrate-binding protein [bacterium]